MSRNRNRQSAGPQGGGNTQREWMKCVALAAGAGVLGIVALLLLFSGLLSLGNLPLGVIRPAGVAIACLGSGLAGYVCSRLNRRHGFFLGLVCGGLLFVLLLLVSLSIVGQQPGIFSLVKLFSMLICGALGGSIGVNAKPARQHR